MSALKISQNILGQLKQAARTDVTCWHKTLLMRNLPSRLLQKVRCISMSARRPNPKFWREAATLIVAAPRSSGFQGTDQEYNVLMLKRGASSPFMPNGYVYPGGCVSEADFDKQPWTALFEHVTSAEITSLDKTFNVSGPRTAMTKPCTSWTESLVPDIAFRICALRETFEESGLLLVTNKENCDKATITNNQLLTNKHSTSPRTFVPDMCTLSDDFDVNSWRKRVKADASVFITLCETYKVVPNIWALYEWCNWLTPVSRQLSAQETPPAKPKRYDTMFYLCCLRQQPSDTEACTDETTEAEWKSPEQFLKEHRAGTIKMFGPQIYESDRLTALRSLNDLTSYIQQREPLGLIQFFPIIMICRDDVVFLLPGDEAYPTNPDREGKRDFPFVEQTCQEFLSSGIKVHRAFRGEESYLCSIHLDCGLYTCPSGSSAAGYIGSDPWKALAHSKKSLL